MLEGTFANLPSVTELYFLYFAVNKSVIVSLWLNIFEIAERFW